jgi:CRP-like cAMP-binding protein
MHVLPQTWNADRNVLLGALSPADRERLRADLRPVTLLSGQVLSEPGERIHSCYFPTSAVVSLLYTMRDGSTVEMALVGREGVLGLAAYLGRESACSRAITVVSGSALRIATKRLQEEFAHAGPLQALLLRYAQAFITQVSQTAVCNRLHSMEQRLCRWLLLCLDRGNCAELEITHELIAGLLGGRRESVTVAAGHLQSAGWIHYCRGHIRILDRRGLESHVCECYRAVEDELDSLFVERTMQAAGSGPVHAGALQCELSAGQGAPPEPDGAAPARRTPLAEPRREESLGKNRELEVA